MLNQHGSHQVCRSVQPRSSPRTPTSPHPCVRLYRSVTVPSILGAAYHLPAHFYGTRTIAIIDAGVDPTLAHDLSMYRTTFGLPACTEASGCLQLENYTGGAQPAPQTGAQGTAIEEGVAVETSLDMDMASAACSSCHLLEISVPWQDAQDDNDVSTGDFATAVNEAVADGASAISISYGYTPDATSTHGKELTALSRTGVAITASAGDEGFNGGIHQLWPSDLPSVISVGGVTLPASGAPSAWELGGSGCETDFPSAVGQPAAVTTLCGGHRAASDVSADADPSTGVAVFDTYAPSSGVPNRWVVVGGTSAAAPYVAGLFARAGHLAAVDGPKTLYKSPSTAFEDITEGNNEISQECSAYASLSAAVCNAGPGWDGPTGLGMPNGLSAF